MQTDHDVGQIDRQDRITSDVLLDKIDTGNVCSLEEYDKKRETAGIQILRSAEQESRNPDSSPTTGSPD